LISTSLGIRIFYNDVKIMEDFEMAEPGKTTGNRNIHAVILSVIGIILLIFGIAIVSIHGNPLRGSGLGTASIVLGVVLLVIAAIRFFNKRTK
jgi:hypothetical protein